MSGRQWQISLRPWRWTQLQSAVWGVHAGSATWVRLADLDQHCWRTDAPILISPWCAVFRVVSTETGRHRWLWFWRHWMSETDYRRLTRLLCLWREHGR